jgi:hypothetical protein
VRPGLRFPFVMSYPCGVGKPRLSLLMTVFIMDSRDILVRIELDSVNFMEDFQEISSISELILRKSKGKFRNDTEPEDCVSQW